jgi:large subunit ribosomal protein L24
MPTRQELKQQAEHIKPKIRKGDKVVIVAGKDKGQIGTVLAVSPKEQKVIVAQQDPENDGNWLPLNAMVKHYKAKRQGERSSRVKLPAPLHISNVMLIDPDSGKPTRVGRRLEGDKIVRYAKVSGKTIVDKPDADYLARKEKKD